MKTLLPFILSSIFPGVGELTLKKHFRGIALFVLPFFSFFAFPTITFYVYLFCIIISLVDVYYIVAGLEGSRRALINLIFGILFTTVVIPTFFYLFGLSMYRGGQYVTEELLNERHTSKEMGEISLELHKYFQKNGTYPANYFEFIARKPIWKVWETDSWDNVYKYTRSDSLHFMLRSSGRDRKFNTEDDLVKQGD